MATVHEVIEAFRQAPSNSERGTLFEQLMVRYFKQDPLLSAEYDRVWQWSEWPQRPGVDTGIDLVARRRDTQELTAIQCKFYEPTHTLRKEDIDSFFTASGKAPFTARTIISTTDRWSNHAEDALKDQSIPVSRIGLADIAESPIDWSIAWAGQQPAVTLSAAAKNQPRQHQTQAIAATLAGLEAHDRGRLIMACGTGKTFTALRLAEQWAVTHADGSARVLFCVPSIQLLSQSLREWTAQSAQPIRSFAVCSDPKASRSVEREDIDAHDVPLPASTDPAKLAAQMQIGRRGKGLTVVFCTYQSLPVVAAAQQQGVDPFDLLICDEAHRTTGVTLQGSDESNFVRVHDADYIKATKRLYMTATPRIYDENVRGKADEHAAVLTSMDDETVYGPELHRLSFGDAVERGLLTDYKVLVLTVDEQYIAGPMQEQIVDANSEITLDDATKIVGCWNGLAKRAGADLNGQGFAPGEVPMQRAVAFLRDINSSKRLAGAFEQVIQAVDDDSDDVLDCTVHHVDGTMNALKRNAELSWLKAPIPMGECRILSNARCLSEGVDVPALDAVMFLNPRNSIVDVVQAVGRVMRRAPGKDYGYIILPVGVPSGMAPEQALADNQRFKVIWDVLNALRAHDDRFNAMINSIELNQTAPAGEQGSDKLMGGHIGPTTDDPETATGDGKPNPFAGIQTGLFSLTDWRDAIYARIVRNVGTRTYWEDWARNVADIARTQQLRIRTTIDTGTPDLKAGFSAFVRSLRDNLNDSITEVDAISMLSQHLITKPVFDALFDDHSFAAQNPVSQVMEAMLTQLQGSGVDTETRDLDRFYASVRVRASEVTTAAGKQQVITELYERFFKLAFAKQADALGIVYTPVEVVDWLLRAANDVLQTELGVRISDEGVHVLDGFTGTGTFIVRLLQSGVIRPEDLARKYATELHANEIMLLAYYIAAVNIEAAYHGLTTSGDGTDEYTPFPGIALADTFQISEAGDRADTSLIPANNDRITAQLNTPITVIVGNPPYSVGQSSANDNNANLGYPTLDQRIAETYAARSNAGLKRNLYDSYVRAYRWATDRIKDRGVVAFVANGGWIQSNSGDGIRRSFGDEYSAIWVFNLRGNARTSGELRAREKGNVFGSGSRNTVALFVGVKNPDHTGPCRIHYRDIGDYLDRDAKLAILATADLETLSWDDVAPNTDGDWIGQRSSAFNALTPIGDKSAPNAVFRTYTLGLATNRDAWCYNFSKTQLEHNIERLISHFNAGLQSIAIGTDADQAKDTDPHHINWSRSLETRWRQRKPLHADPQGYRVGSYRPFTKSNVYFDRGLNEQVQRLPAAFPTTAAENVGILLTAPSSHYPFCAIATTLLPNLHLLDTGQYFPRWSYDKPHAEGQPALSEEDATDVGNGVRRRDNISPAVLDTYAAKVGSVVDGDAVFAWTYGVLHSPQYRQTFAADLTKMLPRIPAPASRQQFEQMVAIGQKLLELHVGYEDVDPYPLHEDSKSVLGKDDPELLRVTKMKWRSKSDRSALVYNGHITLTGIPDEAHQYVLGPRTALEWIIDRYQVRTDKPSGIINDPNDWGAEQGHPRYIIDLIQKVTTVSVETVKLVGQIPELDL